MKNHYKLTKENIHKEERIKACVNIYNLWKKEEWKSIGIITSDKDREKKQECAKGIKDYFEQKNVSVQLITEEELMNNSFEQREAELVIWDLPPVNRYALGLELVKECDTVILVESCGSSKYVEFEKTMKILRDNEIHIAGVVL